MSFPSINRLTRVEGAQTLSSELETGPNPGTAADGGDCPHETGLSVLDAASMDSVSPEVPEHPHFGGASDPAQKYRP